MKDIKLVVATVVSTLLELEKEAGRTDEKMSAGNLYMLLDSDIGQYEVAASVLRKTELCIVTSETIQLTPKGRELAKKIDEAIKGVK